MPIYELECPKCGDRMEVMILKPNDVRRAYCVICQKEMERVISAPNFHLKGTCWAKDGYTMQRFDGSRVVSVSEPDTVPPQAKRG